MNADGSDPRRLTDDPNLDGMPHWSPDGRQIAFKAMRSGRSEFYMLSFRVRNGQVDYSSTPRISPLGTVLDAEAGTWSPDGERIAFASNQAGSFDIWVVDLPAYFTAQGVGQMY